MKDKEIRRLLCNAVYKENTIDEWIKGCILPFLLKSDLGISKNYSGINLTAIPALVYNALYINSIEPEREKIPRKNQSGFRRNRSTTCLILTIR